MNSDGQIDFFITSVVCMKNRFSSESFKKVFSKTFPNFFWGGRARVKTIKKIKCNFSLSGGVGEGHFPLSFFANFWDFQ